MRAISVESTTIATVAYDPARKLLQLEFRRGAIYQYFDVPDAVHQGLLRASSKGSYFNLTIRNRFPFRRLASPQATAPKVVAGRER
jgi:hypothetical protein